MKLSLSLVLGISKLISSSTASGILLETGDNLVTETGDRIVTES